MEIILLLATAIAGTALMSLFMNGMEYITGTDMSISSILGTMLTLETQPDGTLSDSKRAQIVGVTVQYLLGIIFTIIYWQLWSNGIGDPRAASIIFLAILSGIAGMVLWKIFLGFHPYPPAIRTNLYQLCLFCAHFIFALTVYFFFSFYHTLV